MLCKKFMSLLDYLFTVLVVLCIGRYGKIQKGYIELSFQIITITLPIQARNTLCLIEYMLLTTGTVALYYKQ